MKASTMQSSLAATESNLAEKGRSGTQDSRKKATNHAEKKCTVGSLRDCLCRERVSVR